MDDNVSHSIFSEHPDIHLFAEDFVNHILLQFQLPLMSSGIADRRSTLHNAFTPRVRRVADYVSNRLGDKLYMKYTTVRHYEHFRNYRYDFQEMAQEFLVRPKRSVSFIIFFVKVSTYAAKFHTAGFEEAPRVAVGYIGRLINSLNLEKEVVWKELNSLVPDYSQGPTDMDTGDPAPEGPSSGCDSSSSNPPPAGCRTDLDSSGFPGSESSTSAGDSKAPHSSDRRGTKGGDEPSEAPDKLSDSDFCSQCVDSMSFGGLLATKCEHVQETVEVVTRNIEGIFVDDTGEIVLELGDDEDSSSSNQSVESTSSEEDPPKPKVGVKRKNRSPPDSSCSPDALQKAFDGLEKALDKKCCDVHHSAKDPSSEEPSSDFTLSEEPSSDYTSSEDQPDPENPMQCDEPAEDGQVVDEDPAVNDLLASDSPQASEEYSSDDLIDEDEDTDSTEEEDKANSSGAKSCPPRKPDQK